MWHRDMMGANAVGKTMPTDLLKKSCHKLSSKTKHIPCKAQGMSIYFMWWKLSTLGRDM